MLLERPCQNIPVDVCCSLILKNRFGEQSYNYVIGGSNQIDCSFIVDSANGNGLGIRSLKGSGCAAVYMHTSATPAASNPNPAAGYILIQLASNYAGYLGGYSGFVSPVSGTPINVTTGVTAGLAYIITSIGTTTAAGLQALGLPPGLTPTVGQSFIATSTTTTTGTVTIEVPAAGAGAFDMDVVGDANLSVSATGGAYILVRILAPAAGTVTMASYTPAGIITNGTPDTFAGTPAVLTGTLTAGAFAITAPADNSAIGMRFVMTALPNSLK